MSAAVPQTSMFTGNSVAADFTTATRQPTTTLGQDDFLKLLVTKMSSQDPMNPQGDTEFIAQMAQFSALEQSKTMSGDIASLAASGMIGRSVTIKGDSSSSDPAQNADVSGVVSSVSLKDGAPEVVVGGQNYTLDRITTITPYVPQTAAA